MASSSGCAPGAAGRSSPVADGKDAKGSPSEPRPDQRFPRAYRLTARRQFVDVYEKGWRASRPSLAVFGLPNGVGHCRLGLTVTRKVGDAVERNRAKRVLRGIFRRNRERLGTSLDLVVNARRAMLRMPSHRVERDFLAGVAELRRREGRR